MPKREKTVLRLVLAAAICACAFLVLTAHPARGAQSTTVLEGMPTWWGGTVTIKTPIDTPNLVLRQSAGTPSTDILEAYNNAGSLLDKIDDYGNFQANAWLIGANLVVSGSNGHIFNSGGVPNTDMAGTIALSSATSGSYSFRAAYSSAPSCTITPTSSLGTTPWWVTTTTAAVTANVGTASTVTFNYTCLGNPN